MGRVAERVRRSREQVPLQSHKGGQHGNHAEIDAIVERRRPRSTGECWRVTAFSGRCSSPMRSRGGVVTVVISGLSFEGPSDDEFDHGT